MAFIVFEGLDGSGKSTLIKNLMGHLGQKKISFTSTREPGGTQLGEALRELLLKDQDPPPCPKAELLMYEAIRAQHVECKIKPELKKGHWVLSDRYAASSVAFQAGGREISLPETQWLNDFATSQLHPDVTVLLDISYADSQSRMAGRLGEEKDRIEKESQDFHERVRTSYLQQAQENPERWLVLDACLTQDQLKALLIEHLELKGLLS